MTILYGTLAALAVLLIAVSAPSVIQQRRDDVARRRERVLTVVIHVDTEGFRRAVGAAVATGEAIGRIGITAREAAKAVDEFTKSYRAMLDELNQTPTEVVRLDHGLTSAVREAQAHLVTDGHEATARAFDALIPPKADQ